MKIKIIKLILTLHILIFSSNVLAAIPDALTTPLDIKVPDINVETESSSYPILIASQIQSQLYTMVKYRQGLGNVLANAAFKVQSERSRQKINGNAIYYFQNSTNYGFTINMTPLYIYDGQQKNFNSGYVQGAKGALYKYNSS